MLRERNQTFKLIFISLDFALSMLSFMIATMLHFHVLSPEQRQFVMPDSTGLFAPGAIFDFLGEELVFYITYLYLGLFISFVQVVTFIATDLYHPRRGLNWFNELYSILRGVLLGLALVLAILFFYRGTSFSRLVILYTAATSVVLVSFGHIGLRLFLGRMRARGYNMRNVLILGTGVNAGRLLETLKRHSIYGYRVVGVLGPRKNALPELEPMIRGTVRDFKRLARQAEPDLIVYAMPHKKATLQEVIEFCDNEGIDCRIVPDMVEMLTARARVEDMDGMPLLTIRDIPLKNGYNRAIKRTFDIVFAGLFLILNAPIFLVLALMVKISSPGPILFKQERMGLDRRIFLCYKFRTMFVQSREQSDSTWGTHNDIRVTPLGRVLRKTSLDELPQFWNVLVGDMSIVGPRPERPHFVQQFKTRYHHYMRRHQARSGITGWAQIQGWRGDTSIQKRIEADIYYIENWSLWLDVLICLKTIPAMLRSPGE